jgi:hypothetical protein
LTTEVWRYPPLQIEPMLIYLYLGLRIHPLQPHRYLCRS